MNMDEIYKGITFEGTHGYFLDKQFVYELSRDEYYKPTEWHISKAKQMDYRYIVK